MTVDLGAKNAGQYFYEANKTTSCTEYYFYFIDSAGQEWYYPETGKQLSTRDVLDIQRFISTFSRSPLCLH